MKKNKDNPSKISCFSSKTAAVFRRIPFFRSSFLKSWLTIAAFSCFPASMNTTGNPSEYPVKLPKNAFIPNPKFRSSTTFPRDNIVKAFREGRTNSISEFLKLYDSHFRYDTTFVNKENINTRLCHGQYIPKKDVVEIKYFMPDTTDATPQQTARIIKFCSVINDDKYQIPVKAHECSHKAFHNEGKIKRFDCVLRPNPFYFDPVQIPYRCPEPMIKVYMLGLRDAAVINQWNEIGGDLGYLLAERELFLATNDTTVFTYKTAYTEAVKKGEINPFDFLPESRKKEYSLLINSTIEWWLANRKSNYAYTSKSDVEMMIEKAKRKGILLASESLGNTAYKKISTCLTLPIDGRLVNLFKYVKEENRHLTPQPMVEEIVAKAEQEMPMYHYHNRSPFVHTLLQNDLNQRPEAPNTAEETGKRRTLTDAFIPAQSSVAPSGNNNAALWMMHKSFSR